MRLWRWNEWELQVEINTTFESYVIINDEEFKVEVEAVGDLVDEGFSHEFGFTSKRVIDNVFITGIYDLENDKTITFKELNKKEQRKLLSLAEENLTEGEMFESYTEDWWEL